MIELQKNIYYSVETKDMDLDTIYNFIKDSYWGTSRTFEEQKTVLHSSINFGLFHNNKQIAYCRVMTDKVFFFFFLDVFVLDEYQGNGYSKLLIDQVLKHKPLVNIHKWMLATKDAHGLYEQFGFHKVKNPAMLMEKMSGTIKKVYE